MNWKTIYRQQNACQILCSIRITASASDWSSSDSYSEAEEEMETEQLLNQEIQGAPHTQSFNVSGFHHKTKCLIENKIVNNFFLHLKENVGGDFL